MRLLRPGRTRPTSYRTRPVWISRAAPAAFLLQTLFPIVLDDLNNCYRCFVNLFDIDLCLGDYQFIE